MDLLKASKKLKEIKADAYNNLSSGEDESELQLESSTELHNCEPAGGEEVKPDRPKAENVKEYKTLSRTNPMDGNKTRAKPEVYLNEEGEKVKKTTNEEIWAKLEELKKRSTPKPDSIDDNTASMLSGFRQSTDKKLYEEARDAFIDVFKELADAEYGDVLYEPEDVKEMLKAVEQLKYVMYDLVEFKGRGKVLQLLNSMGELE
tara:strand:+ start:897 stop:1508 length:612 start_codon:yes stop_codon:yes gene_type:complete